MNVGIAINDEYDDELDMNVFWTLGRFIHAGFSTSGMLMSDE